MNVYQLHVQLDETEPIIWRRILTTSNVRLDDFHRILQTIMGWTNSHLHLFEVGRATYAPLEFEVEEAQDSRKVKLEDILNQVGSAIRYEYDLGDGWVRTLTLEKIIQLDSDAFITQCIEGERSSPPEDCGGVFGFHRMLEILKDPGHEEYREFKVWLGRSYHPEKFDLNKVNKQLQKKDYGCEWIM
ncbi:plasmid pRiA4b ORF-3 family protein [Algoriphagus sp. H41]|uniref:Plasmid pRiA4b ORF-3 family protein n=1 Tax=Algoriphagus oliviformis TaxID=2811231 RepID=A0ABS3BXE3_9BACT|nr:plasmid pRiA4b ORF-3 family protein [Algoriphagus oliviformis]MBN7809542.1 plasmid pRiA4b ORF-3 family protein [Algoriphagus oliviformis]